MASKEKQGQTSALEWIAAVIGLMLLVSVVGVIGREAWLGESGQPPSIRVVATRIAVLDNGYLVEFEVRNRSSGTAAGVMVEGKLDNAAGSETATATLDYVAGNARANGGLFFDQDPRQGRLQLRAIGYQKP